MHNLLIMDASSLILLGRCGLIEVLSKVFSVIIPRGVLNEVVNEGTLKQYPDANIISELVKNRKIEVFSTEKQKFQFPLTLGEGEMEAIVLTRHMENAILVTDDGKAIKACRYLKIPFMISPKVITALYQFGKIGFMDAKTSIDKLRIIGRYSPEIIAEALLSLEEIKNVKTNNRQGSR